VAAGKAPVADKSPARKELKLRMKMRGNEIFSQRRNKMTVATEVGGTLKPAPRDGFRNVGSRTQHLLSRHELALSFGVSLKTIERWTSRRMIPFLRLSPRLIKYDLARVRAALEKYEVKEAGVRR